jgi:hypothetical protein
VNKALRNEVSLLLDCQLAVRKAGIGVEQLLLLPLDRSLDLLL